MSCPARLGDALHALLSNRSAISCASSFVELLLSLYSAASPILLAAVYVLQRSLQRQASFPMLCALRCSKSLLSLSAKVGGCINRSYPIAHQARPYLAPNLTPPLLVLTRFSHSIQPLGQATRYCSS